MKNKRGSKFQPPLFFFTWVVESTQVWLSWLDQTWVKSLKKKVLKNEWEMKKMSEIKEKWMKRKNEWKKNDEWNEKKFEREIIKKKKKRLKKWS